LSPDEGSAVQLDSLHRASFLEFSFEDLKSDRFTLTDAVEIDAGTKEAPIAFRSLADGRSSYSIQVGACPQWYAFSSTHLVLQSTYDHKISRVWLLGK